MITCSSGGHSAHQVNYASTRRLDPKTANTTKVLCEEWERHTHAIDECLIAIESTKHENLDLAFSIEVLNTQVERMECIYKRVCEKIKASEEHFLWKYPPKQVKSLLCSIATYCLMPLGLGTVASNVLKWTGFGLCAGGAIFNKASTIFAQQWGDEESERTKLLGIVSKGVIIANTRSAVRIFEEYQKIPHDQPHIKGRIATLLRSRSIRGRMLESPLLQLEQSVELEKKKMHEEKKSDQTPCEGQDLSPSSQFMKKNTTTTLIKLWEKSSTIIEECHRCIDETLSESHDYADLNVVIGLLKKHVKKLEKLYAQVIAHIDTIEKPSCCGCPKKKVKAFLLSAASYCATPLGLAAIAFTNTNGDSQYNSNNELKWVGIALCIAGTFFDQASTYLSNSWGSEGSELAQLELLASKAIIITHSNATISIFEKYNKQSPQNKRLLKASISNLLKSSSTNELLINSPLVRLDRRIASAEIALTQLVVKIGNEPMPKIERIAEDDREYIVTEEEESKSLTSDEKKGEPPSDTKKNYALTELPRW